LAIIPAKLLLVETPKRHANDVPVVREAVRAVVLDRDHRVLLFKAFPDNTRVRYFWITPGGGVAAGESASTALRRELTEECGLVVAEIGPLIWVREHVFPIPHSGELTRQRERFYLVRVDQHEVDVSGWDDFERIFMGEHRWWTVSEIQASDDEFAPHRLGHFLADLVNGDIPSEPVDTGV
jgi:8-oxo-dGTP pyrophosphatase MutT (NUDIX family)